jgi:N-methylhydantoinase A
MPVDALKAIRLATDIGGTFTDIVLDTPARRYTTKLLTTHQAPEQAVIDGTATVLAEASLPFSSIDVFVHGTTLATNAIIERKGARTALIATAGFRDVIEIADEGRFDQYDLNIRKPTPLVPRHHRFTVPERVDVHGQVRLPLDEPAVRHVAANIRAAGNIESVAVALIHAYANAAHEQRIGALLAEELPGIAVTLSSEVCPEAREYERTSTAIANAYVQPLMAGYLRRLEQAFAARGYRKPIHLMTSGGSLAALETAARFPIRLVESGPAGGAILAARIAAERGETRIVSFDMGGTTAKICLIDDGKPLMARTFEVDRQSRFMKGSGLPVRIPVIEMVEIGAGGGSLAIVDALKRITVGPESAGSEPGPASYGRGGERPAVTDADLALGKIDPTRFAGGKIAIDADKARSALLRHVGAPLGLDAEAAAHGVSEIVDENMANAARVHAVERGAAVGERTLIAFGGAAPLHASRLAEKLAINRIVVPADAGVGSAIGFLQAPAAYELVRSAFVRLDRFDAALINDLMSDMTRQAVQHATAAAGGRELAVQRAAFMRYAGQGHEISVSLPNGTIAAAHATTLRDTFEAEYTRQFARHIPGAAIEILSWVVVATTGDGAPPRLAPTPAASTAPRPIGSRRVVDTRHGQAVEAAVYERATFPPGAKLSGPCLIVESGTSTYVSPSFDVTVDSGLALVLTAKTGVSVKSNLKGSP